MLPEQLARVKIDRQLKNVGWDIVSRGEYVPGSTCAVTEALMQGNTESDYLLFVDDKAIAVLEAKRGENPLGDDVRVQAEGYASHPQNWYGVWFPGQIPLVYVANGNKIYYKNLLHPDSDYVELSKMHSPKKMLQLIGQRSEFGALPRLDKRGLRKCQYKAELKLEKSIKNGHKKNLAILATGAGKTYLASLAVYRLMNYAHVGRVLFLADRNNLARQAQSEFTRFSRTENGMDLGSLYQITRLRKEEDIKGDIVISTIQKLYAVLTGQRLAQTDEDEEDEEIGLEEEEENKEAVVLGANLALPPDYFQMIIVDECHRSIYGRWKKVLDYFSGAIVLGLTATPTPEAYAFFNNHKIANYTFDDSIVDGVNVSPRVYRIITNVTEHGGAIKEDTTVTETSRRTGRTVTYTVHHRADYASSALDRSVVNKDQIREVLQAYKQAIYEELYPDREAKWEYIPKTLIFAKDDHHATEIVEGVRDVFKDCFGDGNVPENFCKKITYTAGDTDELIRDLRTEKDFRIAVTVTLVATGTDVQPLEVVLFMKDVHSDVLYTQMKGRACRALKEDKLREVTPNAVTKECYYIVDAVGVTESEKVISSPRLSTGDKKNLSLEFLLERLAHQEVSDENLILLRDYCSSINWRYEDNPLFGRHLDAFITDYGFAPKMIAAMIQSAIDGGLLEVHPFIDASHANEARMALIYPLISNVPARRKLLEMHQGYVVSTSEDPDELIFAGFSKETAGSFIEHFEKYINENKDSIEALRIIYNAEDTLITHDMLSDLREHLLSESRQFSAYQIWKNFRVLDDEGNVDDLDVKGNVNALTNLIQIVRYAYGRNQKLTSLLNGYARRFSLYCGQAQRALTEDQRSIMQQIAEYVINDGALSVAELNEIDTDLWRKGVTSFGRGLGDEMQAMARILLKSA